MTLSLTLDLPPASSGTPFCHMVVGKALLNSPRTKQFTEGQLALDSFLARRRLRYQDRRKGLARECANRSCEETLSDYSPRSLGTPLNRETNNDAFLYKRNCVIRLASIRVPSLNCTLDHSSTPSCPLGHAKVDKTGNLSQLNCEELADRIVSQAKVRLKQRKKAANVLQKIYKPVLNSNKSRIPHIRTSTPVNSKDSTPNTLSPSKSTVEAREKLDESDRGKKAARKVVYLSERQSEVNKDSGVPGAPPSSPKPGEHMI